MPRVIRHAVVQPADISIKLIALTQGMNAIVDADLFDEISKYRWHASWNIYSKGFYAVRKDGNGKGIPMHRVILGLVPGDELYGDHINRNGLDNRRSNLRVATKAQNACNSKITVDNTSGYKGVCWQSEKKKWRAQYTLGGKQKHLGYFRSKEDAAQVYALFAYIKFGEFSRLN